MVALNTSITASRAKVTRLNDPRLTISLKSGIIFIFIASLIPTPILKGVRKKIVLDPS